MPRSAPKNTFFYLQIALAVLFVLLFSARLFLQRQEKVSSYYPMPDFTLTERSGKTISNETLRGKVWIADFIFTRCGGQCPLMTNKMKQLSRELKGVSFISFSVDPEFDTPAVLSAYAKDYGVDSPDWFFLTGSKDAVNHVTTGLKFNRVDEPSMHSARFILIDRDGHVRHGL